MEKLDLTKQYKTYFKAKTKPELIDVETANFISITGKGDPSHPPFTEKIEALYPVAYAIKFEFKAKGKDFVVSKLEGLWWFDEKQFPNRTLETSMQVPRSEWGYRLLIRLPDYVKKNDFDKAVAIALKKKNSSPRIPEVEFFTMTEGKCVQALHVGPYATEFATLKEIRKFMEDNRLDRNGLHHEIYLSDFRKTAPEKLKTILREPVKK